MPNSLEELRQKNKGKCYAHFGSQGSMKCEWIWKYIQEPNNIKTHNFYPFISYEKDYSKYNSRVQERSKRKKDKYRELCYSTHLDRCIYQYYGYRLNELYNERVVVDNIDNVAVAYRNSLHKSNIQFALEAIDFIRRQGRCYIMVGDFKSFFESLDHAYLKQRLCNLLNEKKLPDDYYAVYKNITKYAMCRLEDILEFLGQKDTYKNRKQLNKKDCIMTQKELRIFKKKLFHNTRKGNLDGDNEHKAIEKNKNSTGIPQGSAISAVFANVYMLTFDKNVNDFVQQYAGLYMRYSDDFIIVLPKTTDDGFKKQYAKIREEIQVIPSLILEPQKTQIYEYNAENMLNRSADFVNGGSFGKNSLDYLGFTFDGKQVTLRDKTVSKYYYRMYRKAKVARYWSLKNHRMQARSLYDLYSEHKNIEQQSDKILSRKMTATSNQKNNSKRNRGNFLSYVKRAQKEFGDDEPISRGTKRHMIKIKRAIKSK